MNAIGQRSNVAQSGTAFAGSRDITWAYDPLGQVTRADSTIPGLDRAYQFDLIGNRLKTADIAQGQTLCRAYCSQRDCRSGRGISGARGGAF